MNASSVLPNTRSGGPVADLVLLREHAPDLQAITNRKERGEVDAAVDAELEATRIAAYADGLPSHLYADLDGLPPDAALAALRDHLSGKAPGERPRS